VPGLEFLVKEQFILLHRVERAEVEHGKRDLARFRLDGTQRSRRDEVSGDRHPGQFGGEQR